MKYNQVATAVLILTGTVSALCHSEQYAVAADVPWSNQAGGDFSSGPNWTGGTTPLATDKALFDLGSSGYTVDFLADETTDQLVVANDLVTLDLGSLTYTQTATGSTNSIIVGQNPGDDGTLILTNGTVVPGNISIGKTGSTGQLTISTGATVDSGSTVSGSFMIVGDGGVGTVDVINGGHLTGGAVISSQGTVNVSGVGSLWTGSSGGFTTIEGALNISSGGSVINRSSAISGDVLIDGQNSIWAMNGPFGGGVLTVGIGTGKNGPLDTGTVTIRNGAHITNTGVLLGLTGSGHGIITVTGAGSTLDTIGNMLIGSDGSGVINILDGATMTSGFTQVAFENGGDVTVDGAGSTWTSNQTIIIGAGDDASLTIANGAAVAAVSVDVGIAADRPDRVASVDIGGAGASLVSDFRLRVGMGGPNTSSIVVHDSGSLEVGAELQISNGSVSFINGGSGTIGTGALETTANTLRIHADGDVGLNTSLLNPAPPSVLNADNIELAGNLVGRGTINSNLNNSGGIVGPGDGISPAGTIFVTGSLDINGNYTQDAEGGLEINLGGSNPGQFDLLNISGTASLAGTLDATLLSSFDPALNDTFEILSASGGVTGVFDSELLPVLSNGFKLLVQYEPTRVLLVTTSSADFDANGFVDGTDLASWQSSFGVDTQADADVDLDTDGADFLAWQQQFTGTAPLAAATAVPEPTYLCLLCFAIFLQLSRRSTQDVYL